MDASTTFRLIASQGVPPGSVFDLTRDELVLGRDPQLDLPLPLPTVSRRHLRLVRQGDGYTIEDLGSSNGTFVNGERLVGRTLLRSGDQIQLGQSVCFVYEVVQPRGGGGGTLLEAIPRRDSSTLLDTKFKVSPVLVVSAAGMPSRSYVLEKASYTLGRDPDNDIQIPSPIVSRHHARLERESGGYRLFLLAETLNPVLLQGSPVPSGHPLRPGDTYRIGVHDPGNMVSLAYTLPGEPPQEMREIDFGEKDALQIGRDPSNDVVLDAPTVSRFHARLERIGPRYHLRDLNTSNGVYVNNQRIPGEAWLKPEDQVRIGPYRFAIHDRGLAQYNETRGMRVEALHLNKWVRKDLNILKDISLVIQPREFIVVVGQSGGGKSTLVDAISGFRPASHGRVLVNGVDIYRHFDAIRSEIGFVPQRDIIHMELTIFQALDYAAQLRMPRDTTRTERHQRIQQVLKDLDLEHRKDLQISSLSGGQQKRVSIGVELLTRPGLFFLDEPTSGLDPATETALMQLLRHLSDQGHTIVLVTHATKNVALADKVVFLARGGYLAWYGPPNEALEYFDQFRSERDRRSGPMEFDEIYRILENASLGSSEDWAKRFLETPAYYQYIVHPFGESIRRTEPPLPPAVANRPAAPRHRQTSALHQFGVLLARNLRILSRNLFSLVLLLLAPILISALDFLVAGINGRAPFSFGSGDAAGAMVSLFLPTVYGLLVGSLTQMREIVKEVDIYRRERMVCLRILPYALSKLVTALLFAVYQAGVYLVMQALAFGIPGGMTDLVPVYLTILLGCLGGMVLGLLASALAPNAAAAPSILLLLLVPNIILSGGLSGVVLPPALSAPVETHWIFKDLIAISGLTADVAADPCWDLPADVRGSMTIEQKQAYGCRCMGPSIFRSGSCRFPGLGKFYNAALEKPAPTAIPALGGPPGQPALPVQPPEPANQTNTVAMADYLGKMKAWQAEVSRIQAAYQSEIQAYQKQADAYKVHLTAFQQEMAAWQTARESAVRPAEAAIQEFKRRYEWAFVNKNDYAAYSSAVLEGWMAAGGLILVEFLLILVLLKRKDKTR